MACLLVEPVDFSKPLIGGGGRSMTASAIRNLGDRLLLVGSTSGDHPIGRWTEIECCGRVCCFLPVISQHVLEATKIKSYNACFALALSKHRKAISQVGIKVAFTQTWSVLWFFTFVMRHWNICYYYPGFGNAMLLGRRPLLGRILAKPYDIIQAKALKRASVIFAAASQDTIQKQKEYLLRLGADVDIISLPTAVDTNHFKPYPKHKMRELEEISPDTVVYAFVGRLAAVKGIPLILEAMKRVINHNQNSLLLLAGDGEEREKLERLAKKMGIQRSVRFLGMLHPDRVLRVIVCADVCLFASYTEGFSVALLEQLACGRPIVTTDVGGARDLIIEGKNGFIMRNRNQDEFARRMLDALELPDSERISRQIAVEKYCDKDLWAKIQARWVPLRS